MARGQRLDQYLAVGGRNGRGNEPAPAAPGTRRIVRSATARGDEQRQAGADARRHSPRALVHVVILHRVAEDEVRPLRHPTVVSNEPPFLRGQVSPMQDRRPGSSPRGHHRCGTAPGSHRLRWAYTTPAGHRSVRTLSLRRDARHRSSARGSGSTQMGATSSKPMAASSAAAERITTRSACCGPTSWIPMGRPSALRPAHTDAAGDGSCSKGYVNRTQLGSISPLMRPWPSRARRGGGPAHVGVEEPDVAEDVDQAQVQRVTGVLGEYDVAGGEVFGGPVHLHGQEWVDLVPEFGVSVRRGSASCRRRPGSASRAPGPPRRQPLSRPPRSRET